MDMVAGFFVLAVIMALLAMGLWVGMALLVAAGLTAVAFSSVPMGQLLVTSTWSAVASYPLTALPLFIWMGEILARSKLSEDLFEGLAPWMRLPGRLLHVNIAACGVFAAVSGSSAATCATVGRISIPTLRAQGYKDSMVLGTLAGSATLGLLIPPSIILIVYGVATEQSIARLFIAGVIPGIMIMALFSGYVVVWALLNPDCVPEPEAGLSWGERIRRSRRLFPVVALIVGIIGSIYAGLASPTDAAAVGILLSLIITAASGNFSGAMLRDSLISATRTSCMVVFIVLGAAFLSAAVGFIGLPRNLAAWIGTLDLSVYQLLAVLTVFFIAMGCFLDGVSVVILTTAVILPMVQAAGIDPIWFGIYLVIAVEMSQITPPVGFNLFVIQGLTGESVSRIALHALPFFGLLVLAVVLLVAFPELATWLPQHMMAR